MRDISQVLVRLVDIGTVNRQFFFARSFHEFVVDLLRTVISCLGAGDVGGGQVARLARDLVLFVKRLVTRVILLFLLEVRLGVEHREFGGLNVLRPAARQAERELPVAHANGGFVHRHLLPVVIVIETRQQLAGFQGHALIDRQFDDAARSP